METAPPECADPPETVVGSGIKQLLCDAVLTFLKVNRNSILRVAVFTASITGVFIWRLRNYWVEFGAAILKDWEDYRGETITIILATAFVPWVFRSLWKWRFSMKMRDLFSIPVSAVVLLVWYAIFIGPARVHERQLHTQRELEGKIKTIEARLDDERPVFSYGNSGLNLLTEDGPKSDPIITGFTIRMKNDGKRAASKVGGRVFQIDQLELNIIPSPSSSPIGAVGPGSVFNLRINTNPHQRMSVANPCWLVMEMQFDDEATGQRFCQVGYFRWGDRYSGLATLQIARVTDDDKMKIDSLLQAKGIVIQPEGLVQP